jgi:2,3-bisphosphoglycerate-dependent phosphoglycerate mutase
MDRLLVLLRHGQSDGNVKGLFTGQKNPGLTPAGVEEAKAAGRRMKQSGLSFDVAFTSVLMRAGHTAKLTLAELGQSPKVIVDAALNERDYGLLTGKNKADAVRRWGEKQIIIWRRSYAVPPPGGESLRDVVARVIPYYCKEILPCVLRGERTLVVAHSNSLRALLMVLERTPLESVPGIELENGVPAVYWLKADSTVKAAARLSDALNAGDAHRTMITS